MIPKHYSYLNRKKTIFVENLKIDTMKQSLNLKNSIYQQKSSGSFDGLTVKDGMLINNRPDGQTGIAHLAQMKKSMKTAEKISIVARGTAMSEMMEDDCCK